MSGTIWSVGPAKRYDTSAFHEAFNWVGFRHGRAQKSAGRRTKIFGTATKARRVINEKCALQQNARTERTRRCNGLDEEAESDESGSEEFLISIKFLSRPFSSRRIPSAPRRHGFSCSLGGAKQHVSLGHFQRCTVNGNGPKTRTVMEKIYCENLREILLPFFLQCICGGGAPSAVQ